MPSTTISIKPTGLINRRDNPNEIADDQVLWRENIMVIGNSKLKLKKCPGSDRLNNTKVGDSAVVSGTRYYTKQGFRRTYFFSGGTYYHVDDLGITNLITVQSSVFDPTAIPCWAEMRVASIDRLYVSEGKTTGMFSYDGNVSDDFIKENSVQLNFVGMLPYLDRLFGFEEDSEDLYFSKNLDPTNFTDSNDAGVITIGAKRGSKIQAIIIDNQALYIFKNDSVWVLEGNTPQTFQIREVVTSRGLAGRYTLVNTGTSIIGFYSDFEVWSFNGTDSSMKKLTYLTALGGDMTKDLNPIVNKDRLDNMRATFHNDIYRMAFTEDGKVANNMEWCFNTINERDWFTRDNNVACYIKYDRIPDKQELLTGRSDTGILMYQYRGLNYDNQGTTPTMPIRLQTKFVGADEEPVNIRVRRYWGNFSVLGAADLAIHMLIDCRTAESDETIDNLKTTGEYKSPTSFMRINSQSAITSRQIPRHANAKCQNFSFLINENINNRDLELTSFQAEVIKRNVKRSEKVGL